jgi:hypothetical protein
MAATCPSALSEADFSCVYVFLKTNVARFKTANLKKIPQKS